jgi:predicted DNA-binding transcriptional regulator AlpA
MTETRSPYLTPNEVAALTRASVDTLRYWRHLGRGPRSFELGRRVVYARTDVLAWIEEERSRTGGAA